MKTLKVRLTFTEPLLGTWPANQNVAREYIASKGPDAATIEDEVAALGADAAADKAMTVFPRNEAGQPILYDYQVKGFFKDAAVCWAASGGKDEKGKKRAVNERQADRLQEDHRRPDLCRAPPDSPDPQRRNDRVPAPPAGPDSPRRAREPCPTPSRFPQAAPASSRSPAWTMPTKRRFWNGWIMASSEELANGGTPARAASPTSFSADRKGIGLPCDATAKDGIAEIGSGKALLWKHSKGVD